MFFFFLRIKICSFFSPLLVTVHEVLTYLAIAPLISCLSDRLETSGKTTFSVRTDPRKWSNETQTQEVGKHKRSLAHKAGSGERQNYH